MTARERYDLEAPLNRARFATEGARGMVGHPDARALLPIDSRTDIYIRPAVQVADSDAWDLFAYRLIRWIDRAERWFWSRAGARVMTCAFAAIVIVLLAASILHSLLVRAG